MPLKSIHKQLSQRVREAMAQIGAEGDPLVRAAQDERFGDYQSNCAMGLARKLGRKPRDVAAAVVEHLKIEDMCEPPDIAGPGFINFRLKPAYLARSLGMIPPCDKPDTDRVGIDRTNSPQTIVVDLSSLNLANRGGFSSRPPSSPNRALRDRFNRPMLSISWIMTVLAVAF